MTREDTDSQFDASALLMARDNLPTPQQPIPQRTSRELRRFLLAGGATVVVDSLTYASLLWVGAPVPIAKAVGFTTGATFAFVVNRFWTFASRQLARTNERARILAFSGLYLTTLALNVLLNSAVLAILPSSPGTRVLAFLIATGASATMNFLGMKYQVFRRADI